MIQIDNLVKRYGPVRALDGLSLSVEPGAVYGFLGPNGAGKTTTMRILSGLARPDSGQATILGQVVGTPGVDIRPKIGVLPEEPAFYGWMTPMEYLRDLIAPLYGIPSRRAEQRTDELLLAVDLHKVAHRRIHGFSRGMRQRLALAAALLHHPPVLLLDEPASALDPGGRREVLDLIETLRGQTTILLSTHILADVERVCDVIGIVNKGRLVLQARRQELMARCATPLVEVEVHDGFGLWPEAARQLPLVDSLTVDGPIARLLVRDVPAAQQTLLHSLAGAGLLVRRFEIVQPTLEEIFLRLTAAEV